MMVWSCPFNGLLASTIYSGELLPGGDEELGTQSESMYDGRKSSLQLTGYSCQVPTTTSARRTCFENLPDFPPLFGRFIFHYFVLLGKARLGSPSTYSG